MGNVCNSRRRNIRITNAIPNSSMLVIISTQRMQMISSDKNSQIRLKSLQLSSLLKGLPSGNLEAFKNISETLKREEQYRDETLYQFDSKNFNLEDGDSYLTVMIYPNTKYDWTKAMNKLNSPQYEFNFINNVKPEFNLSKDTRIIGDTSAIDYELMNIEYKLFMDKFINEAERQSAIKIVHNRPLEQRERRDIIFYLEDGFVRQGKLLAGQSFRMIESGTLQKKNYPPGIICEVCGQNKCCADNCTQTSGYVYGKGITDYNDYRAMAVQQIDGFYTQKIMYRLPDTRFYQKTINQSQSVTKLNHNQSNILHAKNLSNRNLLNTNTPNYAHRN